MEVGFTQSSYDNLHMFVLKDEDTVELLKSVKSVFLNADN